jgi:UDP-4-amino-4,6-dideoxy-N-acetyl-beta-L-altrosamine transaminase
MKIPYSRQWIGEEEIAAVAAVLREERITQGPKIQEFEEQFAKAVGARYAVAVSSGTGALHLAALALGLQPGDEVITTPLTFLATANAILYAAAKPVFADIEPNTLCLDPDEVERKVTPKTKAVFPVHFGGHPANLEVLNRICEKYGLEMIEDGAHALGAKYRGGSIGDCQYSKAVIFSFHPVKHITTGEGGAITTNDPAIYERLCTLRNHGMTRDRSKFSQEDDGPWYYEMQELGFNYRITDLQAALGIVQLKKLPEFVRRRREIAIQYREGLDRVEEIQLPQEADGVSCSYHLYPIRLVLERLHCSRRDIFEALLEKGIGVQTHYIPIPQQPYYKRLGYGFERFPAAEEYYQEAISLPIFPQMSTSDVQFVIRTLKGLIQSHHILKRRQ